MKNLILEKRRLVEERIQKSFNDGLNIPDIIEKGKWKVGDEKQYQGATWVVGGFNAKGIPLWRKKKDGGSGTSVVKNQTSVNNVSKRHSAELVVRDKDGNWVNVKITYSKGDLGEKLHKLRDMGYDISKIKHKSSKLIEVGNNKKVESKTTKEKDKQAYDKQKEKAFVPKQYFKNAEEMANKMNLFLQQKVDIQKFVDILGKTVNDKGNGTKNRCINAGSGHYSEWDNDTLSYLQADSSGDYLEFKEKPSKEKLDKCAKILKDDLAKGGYNVEPRFYVLDHNSYYQTLGTFGVGISIRVTKKEVKSSSKRL